MIYYELDDSASDGSESPRMAVKNPTQPYNRINHRKVTRSQSEPKAPHFFLDNYPHGQMQQQPLNRFKTELCRSFQVGIVVHIITNDRVENV